MLKAHATIIKIISPQLMEDSSSTSATSVSAPITSCGSTVRQTTTISAFMKKAVFAIISFMVDFGD